VSGLPESCLRGPLDGFRVAVTADRRADELAELLRRQGADVLHTPVIRTLPLASDGPLRRITAELIAAPPDLVVATTGIGIRGWFSVAEAWGLDEGLRAALRRARVVARGPKAVAGARQVGLEVCFQEQTEQLTHLLAALQKDNDLAGCRVVLQLSGEPLPDAVATLQRAGASVTAVPVYEWQLPSELGPIERLLESVVERRLDAVSFTSPPAVRNFMHVAANKDLRDAVRQAFAGDVVGGCVGPVTAAAAQAAGLRDLVWPARGRLGLMVRVLAERLAASRQELRLEGTRLVVQGSALVCSNCRIDLTHRERAVFATLSRRPGAVVPKSALLRETWGPFAADPHLLEVTVARLRRRLEPTGVAVVATPRRGYRLAVR
jgi:uroporphyrinogen-III synthase